MFVLTSDRLHSRRRTSNPADALPETSSTPKKVIAFCALSILIFSINTPTAFSRAANDFCTAVMGTWSIHADGRYPKFYEATGHFVGTDVLVRCDAAIYTDGITTEMIIFAIDEIGTDEPVLKEDSVVGVELNTTTEFGWSWDDPDIALVVIKGIVQSEFNDTDGQAVKMYVYDQFKVRDWRINNNASVTALGAGQDAFGIFNDSGGSVDFRNISLVTTTGSGYTRDATLSSRTRSADGIIVTSALEGEAAVASGRVTVINENFASVTTSGSGARGIVAVTEGGDASVVNKGMVTTKGTVFRSDHKAADGTTITKTEYRRADGIHANSESGNATVVNHENATVTTKGDGARAVYAYSGGGAGTTATATNHGTVNADGDPFQAGSSEYDAYGVVAFAKEGNSSATNTDTGTVATKGSDSDAVLAWNDSSGQTASATNSGTITGAAGAVDANGLVAGATAGAGADESTVSTVNSSTITMKGDQTSGMVSVIYLDGVSTGTEDAPGDLSANNSGSITITGDKGAATKARELSSGIFASSYETDGTDNIGDSADVSVINTGSIDVGTGSGILTEVYGSGNSTVRVTDGTIVAGTDAPVDKDNRWGVGIYSRALVDTTTNDVDDDDDIYILVSGGNTTVTAHGESQDDNKTTNVDDQFGIGIWAEMSDGQNNTAHAAINVHRGATVTADTAVKFDGGKGTLDVHNSIVDGDINFATGDFDDQLFVEGSTVGNSNGSIEFEDGNDEMTIRQGIVKGNTDFGDGDDTLILLFWGRVDGDLDFGKGNDEFLVGVSLSSRFGPSVISGNIKGIETMDKQDRGDLRIEGDVNFSASTLNLIEGGLIIDGTVDLNGGEVIIHDENVTKLAFEINSTSDYGNFKQATVVFQGDADTEIHTQLDAALTNEQQNKLRTDLKTSSLTFVDGGFEKGDESVEVAVKTIEAGVTTTVGTVGTDKKFKCPGDCGIGGAVAVVVPTNKTNLSLDEEPTTPTTPTTPAGSSAKGKSSSGAALGIGLVAVLHFWNSDFFDDETENAEEISSLRSGGISLTGDMPFDQEYSFGVRGTGSRIWVRNLADSASNLSLGSYAEAQGAELGVSYDFGKGFKFKGSIVPEMSVSSANSKLEGHALQLGGSWSKGNFFTGVKLAYEDHDAALVTANPAVNSYLKGNSTMNNTHLQLQTGTKMNYGSMKVKAMVSAFAGDMVQGAYTAESPALTADIPEISQRYEGWKFGLNLTPSKSLETSNGTRMLPGMTFSTMRTTTGGIGSMTISQSDKVGAMTFRTNAQVRGLPETVNMLGLNARIMQSANRGWKLGYAGAEIDDEFHHYALAQYGMRF